MWFYIIPAIVLIGGGVAYFFLFRKRVVLPECKKIIELLDDRIFPGGSQQKREGAHQVMKLLNNKINIQEAEELYMKKIALFYFEKYDSSNERIIQYLQYFQNEKVNFFDTIDLYDFFTLEHQRYTQNTWNDAFAHHEIIVNFKGNPIDYRFVDVNPEFEELTGYQKSDVTGKTIKQVFPSIDEFWIDTYGKVALKGTVAKFDQFDSSLGKHLEVVAYCPQKGQFISFINERKMTAPNKVTIRA